jgi:hypothetical protein
MWTRLQMRVGLASTVLTLMFKALAISGVALPSGH